MNIGKAIKIIMAEKDLSVSAIAGKTGWSMPYVSRCKTGAADPMARLPEWAEVLGMPASELVRRAEQYPDPEPCKQPTSEVAA